MTYSERGCVALAVPDSTLCIVHIQMTVRGDDDEPIHCYACDTLIRKGARWIVRTEGAFHARPACLAKPLAEAAITVRL